ncbi:hypothetical protein RJ639_007270 [Escallonia herrerae]|nr:hypothetical protein RJ639_007270 [Escallonia herrerae]
MKLTLPGKTLMLIQTTIVRNDTPTLRSSLDDHSQRKLISSLLHRTSRCLHVNHTMAQVEHLARFTSGMNLHLVPDQIMCLAFPVTLKGATHVWFQHLTPRSIFCGAQLAESFRDNFLTSRVQRKNSSALFHIVQGPKESLKSYYARFNTEKLLINHLDPRVTFAAKARGVRPGMPLRFSLNKRPPKNMTNLLDKVEKYLQAKEDTVISQEEANAGHKRRDRPEGRASDEPKRSWKTLHRPFTPLNTSREHILNQIKGQNILKWPKLMKMPADKRDAQLYCHFHKDHGHTIKECKILRHEIENLIVKGHLKRGRNQRRKEEALPKEPSVINTISGGLSAGRILNSARKAYARQVNLTQGPAKRPKTSTTIGFDDSDLGGVILPHDNVLRILVDTGSSADIIFEEAFSQMRISKDRVRPVSSPLYGFMGTSAPVEGMIPLTVITRALPLQKTQSIDFLVVKVKSTYNAILGRAGLNKLQAVASAFHLCMKFPTPNGIGMVKGDQAMAHKCYMASCKAEEALTISSHSITVLTDKPLRRILHKPDLVGRLVLWFIELGEFDIHYKPCPSIKGQALADFIIECTLPIDNEEQRHPPHNEEPFTWTLHVDMVHLMPVEVGLDSSSTARIAS